MPAEKAYPVKEIIDLMKSEPASGRRRMSLAYIMISDLNDSDAHLEELKKILEPYAPNLTVTADTPEAYSLDGPYSEKWKKAVFFGAAQIKKN